MFSCHVTVVEWHLNITCCQCRRHSANLYACWSCITNIPAVYFKSPAVSLPFKTLSFSAREVQSWPDFILTLFDNTCRLKEMIHFYIWHCLDMCVYGCSHCSFMRAIISSGYEQHKSGFVPSGSHRKSNKAQSLCYHSIFLSLDKNPDGTSLYITA